MKNYIPLYLLASLSPLVAGIYLLFPYLRARRRESLEAEFHNTSCLMQRNLQGYIKGKRQEYMGYLIQSLTLLRNSYEDPIVTLTDLDRRDMLELCLRQAKPFFMGLWEPTRKEEVDLKNIPLLFAEKIHTLNMEVEIDICSKMTSTLKWEPVFMEVLLINAIGKIIYRLPNRGKVSVSLRKKDGVFHLEIRDTGYVLTGSAASLISHLHDFFLEDDAFREICRDNGIGYSTAQSKDGAVNVTYLIFPAPTEEIANRNIEQL